ncbi:hypothetical protein [Streptomyces sp. MP131-18]|uniref:hypothetical protein n=1 Tax=Streptomyces sp. MP131-18 TaxID=1857892 RepID=UPI0009C9ACAE|nr:hypothetical protein [Streptomyces sp. MP131-18]ONK09245.1 hypothetical protein STBA_71000 [Streptomyces sp. MP131-18]
MTTRRAQTLWEMSLTAGNLLADIGNRETPGEEVPPAREPVVLLIGAGIHHQLARRGLLDGDLDIVWDTTLLGTDGLLDTLERSAYTVLEASPADEPSRTVREQLLATGASTHPDDRYRWERVRAAATAAVRAAGTEATAWARLPTTLQDVIDGERRRRQLAQLAEHFSEEY